MTENEKERLPIVLAVDPTVRGMGYVVMEGPNDVIDWGTTHSMFAKNSFVKRKVAQLIRYCSPEVMVIENVDEGKRCARVVTLLKTLERMANENGITVAKISRSNVQAAFSNFEVHTKHEIAEKLTEFFPPFKRLLPGKRKIWDAEDARYGVFDAAALGFAYYYLQQD